MFKRFTAYEKPIFASNGERANRSLGYIVSKRASAIYFNEKCRRHHMQNTPILSATSMNIFSQMIPCEVDISPIIKLNVLDQHDQDLEYLSQRLQEAKRSSTNQKILSIAASASCMAIPCTLYATAVSITSHCGLSYRIRVCYRHSFRVLVS